MLIDISILEPTQEQLLLSTTPAKEKQYTLTVRFGASNMELVLCQGTHKECLLCCKVFVSYTRDEHRVHRTGREFKCDIITPDRIVVTSTRNNAQYAKHALWATFEIKEVQDAQQ